jgi:translation elongation factor EF-4
MLDLHKNDIFTKVSRFNLIRDGRMIYIDVHQAIQGQLAAKFVAVPNLVNIIAIPEKQGIGESEQEAVKDCLTKIKGQSIEEIFPNDNDPGEKQA